MASPQRTIDREGAPAPLIASSLRKRTSTVLAVGLSLFTLVEVSASLLEPLRQLALFFSFALALTFLLYPIFPHSSSRLFLAFDLLLASLSSAVGIYITLDYWDLIFRAGMPTRLDLAMSIVAVLLVLEATRRTLGKPLVIINGVFLLYVFYGHFLPPPLSKEWTSAGHIHNRIAYAIWHSGICFSAQGGEVPAAWTGTGPRARISGRAGIRA